MAKKARKKPRKKPARKTGNAWYGVVIDGKRTPFYLTSLRDAKSEAASLRKQGYKVAVYNQDTNRIVK